MAFDNKRGQEGITLTTILLLVLGVVVVVLVIMFATGFFDRLDDVTNAGGSKMQVAIRACELVGEQELKSDYCSTLREIETESGQEKFVTCEIIASSLAENKRLKDSCGDLAVDAKEARDYCINKRLDNDQIIQISSTDYTCEQLRTSNAGSTNAVCLAKTDCTSNTCTNGKCA